MSTTFDPISNYTPLPDPTKKAAATEPASSADRKPSGSLDKDGFMKLLVSQLKNQDPMNAKGTDEMMSQMTQLSMLEQVQNLTAVNEKLNTSQTTSQALSLVGHNVKFLRDDGSTGEGTVKSVQFADGVAQMSIGDQTGILMKQVTEAS